MKSFASITPKLKRDFAIAAAFIGVSLFAYSPAFAVVIFSDTEFDEADWISVKAGDTTPGMNGTFSVQQDFGVGNPGPSRRVTATWTANPAIGNPSQGISINHRRPTDVYDPSTQGAITSFDVSLDGNEGFSIQIHLFQDGLLYELATSNFPGSSSFVTNSAVGLVAADFTCIGCPETLDLSASGSPISFTFATSGSTLAPGTRNRVGWFDNWRVTIRNVVTVSEPGSLPVYLTGLVALVIAIRLKSRAGPAAPSQ